MKKVVKRGQAIVEMALVLPVFILVIIGIFDFGRVLHSWASLNYQCVRAARSATRRINPLITGNLMLTTSHPTLAEVATVFNQYRSPMLSGDNYLDQSETTYVGTGTPLTVKVYFSQTGIGTSATKVEIKASYNLNLITPLLGRLVGSENRPGALTIHAYASESKE